MFPLRLLCAGPKAILGLQRWKVQDSWASGTSVGAIHMQLVSPWCCLCQRNYHVPGGHRMEGNSCPENWEAIFKDTIEFDSKGHPMSKGIQRLSVRVTHSDNILIFFFEIHLRFVRETGQMCYFQFAEEIMFEEIEWFSQFLCVGKWCGAGTKSDQDPYLGPFGACLISVLQHSAPMSLMI